MEREVKIDAAHCGCRTQDTSLMRPPPWAPYVPGGGTVGLSPPPDPLLPRGARTGGMWDPAGLGSTALSQERVEEAVEEAGG